MSRASATVAAVIAVMASLAWASPAAAFNTRADNRLAMGPNVELSHLIGFEVHRGNEVCPGADTYPHYVYHGQSKSFCYEARGVVGEGAYDTEFGFRYAICLPVQSGCASTGYDLFGHVLIRYAGTEDNVVTCVVVRVDPRAPVRHFDCNVTSLRDLRRDRDPSLTWKLTYTPTPPEAAKVYFIGDSVTAGFGYCGTEAGADPKDITCRTNEPFANAWLGPNSLNACKPPEPVDDRCSNDNYGGHPWSIGPWARDPNAPTVAYPYVIAKEQQGADPALVYDWAMTGSTPSDWDPAGGRFGEHLKQIKDSYVVMTMGANPLLSYYLNISAVRLFPIAQGICAKTTVIEPPLGENEEFAAPLDAELHRGGRPGALRCFDEHWASLEQSRHLVNVYKTLLQNGNHVLVVGYPAGCPWSFGDWQVVPNFVEGPASGLPCTSRKARVWDGSGEVSQSEQASALVGDANEKIKAAVSKAADELPGTIPADNIRFALPDQAEWAKHQAWDSSPWFFKNDTWVHPSVEGHKQLAATVVKAMCSFFHHWCGTSPQWNGAGPGSGRGHSR